MKLLIVGSGGREHALTWKLAQSPLVSKLFCVPGNPGMAQVAQCVSGDPLSIAQELKADFVVVGPEVPLAEGLVNQLNASGIAAFGPNQKAAQLEGSKDFCKQLLKKYNIPTATFETFYDGDEAKEYLRAQSFPIVIKADGLAAGKGVIIAQNLEESLNAVDSLFAMQHDNVQPKLVIEEFLEGEEVSLIALTDGQTIVPLVPAQDHKRIGEGDTGLNTGGMGCYSPVPAFDTTLYDYAVREILEPTLQALQSEGIEYRGALYAGLMLTKDGPKVLEYNCRFGDPETQVILPRLQSDLLPLLLACAGVGDQKLSESSCQWTNQTAVCVVMASQGYPGDYRKGDAISGLDEATQTGAVVFHAGTKSDGEKTVTNGGRVLGITALGDDFQAARGACYNAVETIHFDGAYYRRDIGWRCL
jgi:phosphoribosylamine--glycine ligase